MTSKSRVWKCSPHWLLRYKTLIIILIDKRQGEVAGWPLSANSGRTAVLTRAKRIYNVQCGLCRLCMKNLKDQNYILCMMHAFLLLAGRAFSAVPENLWVGFLSWNFFSLSFICSSSPIACALLDMQQLLRCEWAITTPHRNTDSQPSDASAL